MGRLGQILHGFVRIKVDWDDLGRIGMAQGDRGGIWISLGELGCSGLDWMNLIQVGWNSIG